MLLAVAPPPAPRDGAEVLKTVCARCHWGAQGGDEGGFSQVLSRRALLEGGYLVPGEPRRSPLVERVEKGEMPPAEALPSRSPAQRRAYRLRLAQLLRAWVEAGAPLEQQSAPRWVGPATLERRAVDDVSRLPLESRSDARYLSLAEVAREGGTAEQLERLRAGLAKALSSLSWQPQLAQLTEVGDDGLLYRVSLAQLGWGADAWETTLLDAYPFGVARRTQDAARLAEQTQSRAPVLRADWLVAEATRPPLYPALLRLPSSAQALEFLLGVDAERDVRAGRVMRAGFNGSGVSQNNRLLERHDARFGAYWRSYDFSSSTGEENLFAHPLGPCLRGAFDCPRSPFRPAGGEYIFTLPNGMLGFFLSNGTGQRLDKAPIAIVRDPRRPDGAVETGQSCLSCHARGFFPKADQLRPAVLQGRALSAEERALVERLHPEPARFAAQVEADNRRFLAALERLGVSAEGPEPVSAVAEAYRGELTLARAAAELGLRPEQLGAELEGLPTRFAALGALATPGGTVKRDAFTALFEALVAQLELGAPLSPEPPAAPRAAPGCGQSGPVEERVEDCARLFPAAAARGGAPSQPPTFTLVSRDGEQEVWRENASGVLFTAAPEWLTQEGALDFCVRQAGARPAVAELGGRWSLPVALELERALRGGLPARGDLFWSQDLDESRKTHVDGVVVAALGRRAVGRDELHPALCVQR